MASIRIITTIRVTLTLGHKLPPSAGLDPRSRAVYTRDLSKVRWAIQYCRSTGQPSPWPRHMPSSWIDGYCSIMLDGSAVTLPKTIVLYPGQHHGTVSGRIDWRSCRLAIVYSVMELPHIGDWVLAYPKMAADLIQIHTNDRQSIPRPLHGPLQ